MRIISALGVGIRIEWGSDVQWYATALEDV